MKTLFFGGSFDPIGNHHLLLAQLAMESAGYDLVALVPVCEAPHKSGLTDFNHRLEMCIRATEGMTDTFRVSRVEKDLFEKNQRASYTIETVRWLKETKHDDVAMLIGTDCLKQLTTWKEWGSLLVEAKFVVAPRGGDAGFSPDMHLLTMAGQGKHIFLADFPQINVSSTLIRDRIRHGQSIRYLVPRSVEDYIETNKLYRE